MEEENKTSNGRDEFRRQQDIEREQYRKELQAKDERRSSGTTKSVIKRIGLPALVPLVILVVAIVAFLMVMFGSMPHQ